MFLGVRGGYVCMLGGVYLHVLLLLLLHELLLLRLRVCVCV